MEEEGTCSRSAVWRRRVADPASSTSRSPEPRSVPVFSPGQRHVTSYKYSYRAIHVVMALNIRNAETERLAAELARLTGQTKTAAVTEAIQNHLERLRREQSGRPLADELDEIGRQCAKLPARDGRLADEILGYDEHGLPR